MNFRTFRPTTLINLKFVNECWNHIRNNSSIKYDILKNPQSKFLCIFDTDWSYHINHSSLSNWPTIINRRTLCLHKLHVFESDLGQFTYLNSYQSVVANINYLSCGEFYSFLKFATLYRKVQKVSQCFACRSQGWRASEGPLFPLCDIPLSSISRYRSCSLGRLARITTNLRRFS